MKQATIAIGNDRIKIKVSRRINKGFSVWVNDKKYFFAVLTYKEAFDKGYAKYVKENR